MGLKTSLSSGHYVHCPKAQHNKHLVVCALRCPFKGGNKKCSAFKRVDKELIASLVTSYNKEREADKKPPAPEMPMATHETVQETVHILFPTTGLLPIVIGDFDPDNEASLPAGRIFILGEEIQRGKDAKAKQKTRKKAPAKAAPVEDPEAPKSFGMQKVQPVTEVAEEEKPKPKPRATKKPKATPKPKPEPTPKPVPVAKPAPAPEPKPKPPPKPRKRKADKVEEAKPKAKVFLPKRRSKGKA